MMIDMKGTILDLLEKEDDITLSTGENEYYIENDKYSVTIEYSLYRNSGCFDTETVSMKWYSFKILSILIDKLVLKVLKEEIKEAKNSFIFCHNVFFSASII